MFKKHYWNVWFVMILFVLFIMLPYAIAASDTEPLVLEWAIRIKSTVTIETVVKDTGATLLGQIAHIERTWLISFPSANADQAQVILIRNQDIEWFAPQLKKQKFPREIVFDLVYSDPIFPYQWHLENTGQSGGTPDLDIHVRNVWQNMNILGTGVVIGIVDNGVQYTHPDLSFNFVPSDSWDFVDNDADPSPNLGQDTAHGTTIAGLAAARDNFNCGLGVAYRAGIAGIRLTSQPVSDAEEAIALSYQRQSIDIYTYTWGAEDNGHILEKPGPLTMQALALNTVQGRNSLGNIYVAAAGNGNGNGDNVNYDGLANSRYTIAVGSVDHNGLHAAYSEKGAALMIVAPGSGDGIFISGTDLQGLHGESCGDCQDHIHGTSASAAQVAGVIALMIEANPDLSWRDVQHILIQTTTKNDPDDDQWIQNAAGLHFNPKYGFGLVNAETAVQKAISWTSVNPTSYIPYKKQVDQPIPDNTATGISSTINVNASTDYKIEHVEVVLNATHEYRGQLEIALTSPSGVKSVLAESHADAGENYASWTFMTVQNWGEAIQGDWQLTVIDNQGGHTGTLISWELILHLNGEIGPLPPMARDDHETTAINSPVTINAIANDFDPNGDDLTIIDLTTPKSGSVIKNADQTITYTPDANFLGTDQFQYTISDGRGGVDTATVFISTVIINDPGFEKGTPNPFWVENSRLYDSVIMASPDLTHSGKYLVQFKGGQSGKEVATCDQDVIMPEASHASLTFWMKIPAADVYGHLNVVVDGDFFIFTISQINHNKYKNWRPVVVNLDGFADGRSHNIKFQATIQSGNGDTVFLLDDVSMSIGEQPPVASNDSDQTEMNQPLIIDVLANDYDPNMDRIYVTQISTPQHGTVVENYDKTITYTPEKMFVGDDIFTYTISDQKGGTHSAQVHVSIVTNKKLILSVPEKVIEGEGTIVGKLSVPEILTEDLEVYLKSSDTSEIQCALSRVTMQAGKKEQMVQFFVIDDTEPDGFQNITISVNAAGWISTEVSIEVADNDVGPLLMVTPEAAKLPSQSGTFDFQVQNKGQGNMAWTAVCSQTWIRVISGQAGTNSGTIRLQYDTNPNQTLRTANLVVMAPEAQNSQMIIPIVQDKGSIEPPILKVSPTEFLVGYAENKSTLYVENLGPGNMVWQARANVDWLIITAGDNGVNAGQIIVQYLTNTGATRQGTVHVTAPGATNSPVKIVFTQKEGHVPTPILHVDPTLLTISEKGGNLNLTVSNQGEGQMFWHSKTETSWLTILSGHTGVDEGTVSINCNENLGPKRSGKIIIACAESSPPTILVQIQQDKCPAALIDIEPKSVEVSGVNGSVEFHVKNAGGGNMNWTATTDHSWLNILSGGSGVNEGIITVAYEKNIDDVRIGTITVTSPDAENQTMSASIQQRTFGEVREQKLILGKASDRMGEQVGMAPNLIIAGASMNDERGSNAGKAYIWRYKDSQWQQEAHIYSSDAEQYDYFGCAVDISGNIAVVGAYGNDDNLSQSGSAYVFRYNNSSWIEESKIVASDGYLNDNFGNTVAISASYIIIGANEDDDLGSNSGSAYIFTYDTNSEQWKEQTKLQASDGESYDNFACSVDISGDYAIVGADCDDDHGSSSGAAYIFKRELDSWSQLTKLTPNDGSKYDRFGYDVAISDHYAVIGAYADDSKGNKSGSAYVYENVDGTWLQAAKLIPSDGTREDFFGWSVAISGNNVIVGAYGDDDNGSRSGSAYVFQRIQETWTEMKKITAGDGEPNDYFAYSVSISGHYALIGAYGDDDYGTQSGAVYVYDFRDALASEATQVISQTPQLKMTQIPPLNNRIQDLKGCVTGLDTSHLRVNVYSNPKGMWHTMCIPATLSSDGCWSCDITKGPYDHQAQSLFIFVLPQMLTSPELLNGQLPDVLYEKAVLMKNIQR
jgi:subtilisin-like proprotein convertase family protein